MIFDFLMKILEIHFCLYMKGRSNLKPKLIKTIYKYVGGIVFVAHDWLTNMVLSFKWGKPLSWKELVTSRVYQYLRIKGIDAEKYAWGVKYFVKIVKIDPLHYNKFEYELAGRLDLYKELVEDAK